MNHAWNGLRFVLGALFFFRMLLPCSELYASGQMISPPADATSETEQIRSRYAVSVLPTEPLAIESVQSLAAEYAKSLGPEGNWAGVDYQSMGRAEWRAVEHLRRTVVMAKAARLKHDRGDRDPALDSKVIKALRFWDDHDYQNPNWWWNQIGVPELTGEIASLMFEQLPAKEVLKVVKIMKRCDWRQGDWGGANLTWAAIIQIIRGCLEGNSNTVAEGYDRMYQEIKIVGPTEEGIQQDNSFHQHGEQLYNGGYGLPFAIDIGRVIAFAWGTRFAIPRERLALYSSYLLDGEQWMIRGDVIDYSTVGRGIARQGLTVTPHDLSAAGPAYSLESVVAMLAGQPIPRRAEFEAFAARLRKPRDAPELVGNKQFWCSDFMVHHRKEFYTSVKMLSTRMLNGELVNGEGKKSFHLSDGVNLLYLTGDEYKDIFPVWDWTKLPGTTQAQGELEIGGKNSIGARGRTTFTGGVSDGLYGLATMDLARGDLVAKKAWFFFDEGYVCLGAGITLSDHDEHDVVTDVNQTLLKGEVLTSQAPKPIPYGAGIYDFAKTAWVYHDHVGYIFYPNTCVFLSAGPQSGKWSEIGSGSDQKVTIPVFDLWIDHGPSPRDGAYQYLVFPGLSSLQVAARAENPGLEVLSNSEDIQAVYSPDLKLVEAIFRKPTSLATPLGQIGLDHACLLMVRKLDNKWRVTASNPENEPLTLNVQVNGQAATIDLPKGRFAGSSATMAIAAQQD